MKNKNKQRILWLDIIKALTMILVILGHTFEKGSLTRNWIFSFHMPLFFMISGYTFPTIQNVKITDAIKKDFIRLIIPIFIMRSINALKMIVVDHDNVLHSVTDNLLRILWGNGNDYQIWNGLGILWFLIALFWAKTIYRCLLILSYSIRIPFLLLTSLIGMWIGYRIRLPQCLDLLPLIMLFMEVGHLYRIYEDCIDSIVFDKWYSKTVLVIVGISLVYTSAFREVYIEMALREYPYWFGCVLIAVIMGYIIVTIGKIAERHRIGTKYFNQAVQFIGANTLDLLCIHHIDGYINQVIHWAYIDNIALRAGVRVILDIIVLVVWIYEKHKIAQFITHQRLWKNR